jgi:WD40 repeat protein
MSRPRFRRKLFFGLLSVLAIGACVWLTVVYRLPKPRKIAEYYGGGRRLTFSPDGRLLCCDVWQTIDFWDTRTGALVCTLYGMKHPIKRLAISPKGDLLAAAGYSSSIVMLWEIRSGKHLRACSASPDQIDDLVFSPDGKLLISVGCNADYSTVHIIWDIERGNRTHTIRQSGYFQGPVTFSSDGIRLLTGDKDFLTIRDAQTGREISRFANPLDYNHHLSPDGKRMVSAVMEDISFYLNNRTNGSTRLVIRDTLNGRSLAVLPAQDVTDFAVGLEDMLLTGYDGELKLWDSRSGVLKHVLSSAQRSGWQRWIERWFPSQHVEDIRGIYQVALSPDGKTAAVATLDGAVFLWPLR